MSQSVHIEKFHTDSYFYSYYFVLFVVLEKKNASTHELKNFITVDVVDATSFLLLLVVIVVCFFVCFCCCWRASERSPTLIGQNGKLR